jgi:hypothetical protein
MAIAGVAAMYGAGHQVVGGREPVLVGEGQTVRAGSCGLVIAGDQQRSEEVVPGEQEAEHCGAGQRWLAPREQDSEQDLHPVGTVDARPRRARWAGTS